MYQCDDTIFSSRFEPEHCMRTFSQSEPTRLLSILQGASISQQHRRRCHGIQGPYHQYPQVPTVSLPAFRLVPCPTLLNTVPTHFTHDETQRVATKPDFHQQKQRKKKEKKCCECMRWDVTYTHVFFARRNLREGLQYPCHTSSHAL